MSPMTGTKEETQDQKCCLCQLDMQVSMLTLQHCTGMTAVTSGMHNQCIATLNVTNECL